MKWFNRTAQVSIGFCPEAATDRSPGLQPWVRSLVNSPRKWRPKVGSNLTGQIFAGGTVQRYIFRPYRASSVAGVYPRPKGWGMMYNTSPVKRTDATGQNPGCSLIPIYYPKIPPYMNQFCHSL